MKTEKLNPENDMNKRISTHDTFDTLAMPVWNPRPEQEIKDMFLNAMGAYYAEKMPISRNDCGTLPGITGDRYRFVPANGNDRAELYCADDLMACRVSAIPESIRDSLDYGSREEWAEAWVRFVAEWNDRPRAIKLCALVAPRPFYADDARKMRYMCAYEAFCKACKEVPNIEAAFGEWYFPQVKALLNSRLSVSITEEDESYLVTLSLNYRSRRYDPRSGKFWYEERVNDFSPDREKALRAFPVLKTSLLMSGDDGIRDMARRICENIDRGQSDIHDGIGNWFDEYVSAEELHKFNECHGFTGPVAASVR